MRKTHWVSLCISLVVAATFAGLEYLRGIHFRPNIPGSPIEKRDYVSADPKSSWGAKLGYLMHRAELSTYDTRFKLRGKKQPHPDIVIIGITAESLEQLKLWPWPRSIHARLIQTLAHHPPKALLFDIFFIEPFTSELSGDKALAKATKENPWVVHSFYYEPSDGPIKKLVLPFPELLEVSEHLGYANASIDEDGTLRAAVPQRRVQDQYLNFMSVVGAALYLNKPVEDVLASVPLDSRGQMLVHFTGEEFSYRYIPYHDVLSGKVSAKELAGKVVLVGSNATGTFDHYPTPLSKFMPGVEFHANVIDNLLRMNLIKPLRLDFTYAGIAVFGLFCGLLIARYSAAKGALWAIAAGLIYVGMGQWLFVRRNIAIDMAGPLLTLGLGYLATVMYRFFTEEKEKRWVKAAFGQYVSPKVLDVLMADPRKLQLGGERRDMTVLFSDVAGFTSISERMDPEQLVVLLNRYLTAMTDVVFEYDGYLNKYMGDGIMAFWNAPVKQVNHAELACRAALKSRERLKAFNEELKKEGLMELKARIGLNSGTMVVGNMGSAQKSDYTVMGDKWDPLESTCRHASLSIL